MGHNVESMYIYRILCTLEPDHGDGSQGMSKLLYFLYLCLTKRVSQ